MFNTTIRTRSESSSSYHSTEKEPPIAVYLAQFILSHTRKLNIVDRLCHLGLCISGDRSLDISASMGNRAIEQYKKDGVVCPLNLRLELFTTAAVDNIDVNPSSNQAMPSFPCTAASLHQHIEGDVTGHKRNDIHLTNRKEIEEVTFKLCRHSTCPLAIINFYTRIKISS